MGEGVAVSFNVLYGLAFVIEEMCKDHRQIVTSDVVGLWSTRGDVGEIPLIATSSVLLYSPKEESQEFLVYKSEYIHHRSTCAYSPTTKLHNYI